MLKPINWYNVVGAIKKNNLYYCCFCQFTSDSRLGIDSHIRIRHKKERTKLLNSLKREGLK